MAAHYHHVPGRLRLHVPAVKGSSGNGQAVEQKLLKLKGVSRVESRPVTGSVVVHYDAAALDASALFAALDLSGNIPAAAPLTPLRVPPARSNQIAAKAAKMVVGYALEKAIERAVPLLLAAIL